jgi:hypothetical protein
MEPSTVIGSAGVALLLAAFGLNLSGRLPQDGRAYPALNLVGAATAAYASWLISFLPFVVLEGVWAIVAGLALLRSLRR